MAKFLTKQKTVSCLFLDDANRRSPIPEKKRRTRRARRGPRRQDVRRRGGSGNSVIDTQSKKENSTGKEEVMQTCVSLPRLTLHNYSHQCLILVYLFVLNLNIILQSINLIACDVQYKSVFDFGRSIEEGKIW